ESVATHHHAGRAEPALEGIVRDERRLDGSKLLAVREALDGGDRLPDRVERKDAAGGHRLVPEHHGARAARSAVAADLGPGETEIVAQHAGERGPRLYRQAMPFAVDRQLDRHGAGPELPRLPRRGRR